MRRTDREVTAAEKIDEIIQSCDCCRLGFSDEKSVYIVPLNFGYENTGGKRFFYFHGVLTGRKIDLVRKTGYAGFELDTNHKLNKSEAACDFSFRFRSVIGEGPVYILNDPQEKRAALSLIMAHYSEKGDWAFPDAALNKICVFRLEVKSLSCKEHL